MKLIEIIREPCVLCPKTAGIVSESECQKCEHFYGWNLGETKIGCEYGEVDWYEVSDGVNRYTTDDWHVAVEVVTDWHNCLMDDSPEKEFPEPENIFRHVLKGCPDVTRLNALIEAWEVELIDCYGYIEFPVRVKRVSEIDAHSVVED